MTTIYMSLGSNVGNRAENIAGAIQALPLHGVTVTRQSSIYQTEPVDTQDQGWFLNCVIEARTDLLPAPLIGALLRIEKHLGRRRRVFHGPRTIDIDILLFGSSIVSLPQLEIPHPRMTERRFVLVPFAEIAPEVLHPVCQKTIATLLADIRDRSKVYLADSSQNAAH